MGCLRSLRSAWHSASAIRSGQQDPATRGDKGCRLGARPGPRKGRCVKAFAAAAVVAATGTNACRLSFTSALSRQCSPPVADSRGDGVRRASGRKIPWNSRVPSKSRAPCIASRLWRAIGDGTGTRWLTAMGAVGAAAAGVTYGKFRALTKIRVRERPDVTSSPTGIAVDAGEVFEAVEVVYPETPDGIGYLRVAGHGGWVFDKGISGEWAGRRILEKVSEGASVTTEDAKEEQEDAAAEMAAAPKPPTMLDLSALLSWCRSSRSVKIHPAVSVKGSYLVVSTLVPKGTPLIGVMPDLWIEETLPAGVPKLATDPEYRDLLAAAEAVSDKVTLRLALRLLREQGDPKSPWKAYIRSLAPLPAAPMLWPKALLSELQFAPVQQAARDQRQELDAFAEQNSQNIALVSGSSDAELLVRTVATVIARATKLGGADQRLALIPLIDLVGPPEGPSSAFSSTGQVEPCSASCELVFEGDPGIPVLYAVKDLNPGDMLTRDFCLSSDELLLKHGLPSKASRGDMASTSACLADGLATDWQVRAIAKIVKTKPGRILGDLVLPLELRLGANLEESLSDSFFRVGRILACGSPDEMEIYEDDDDNDEGLEGVLPAHQKKCISSIITLVRGCKGDCPTTIDEDVKALPSLQGCKRIATAFRLERKRIFGDVLEQLEGAAADLDKEAESTATAGGALPFAVTGQR